MALSNPELLTAEHDLSQITCGKPAAFGAGAHLVGGRALLVNALDEEAAVFWRHHGFIPSQDDPFILFRSISDIAASLTKAGISAPAR